MRIICWCPTPAIRDAVAAAIDAAIDQMSFLILPDDTNARVVYRNTASYDQAQNALLYRRDLIYTVEYPTVTVDPATVDAFWCFRFEQQYHLRLGYSP